ncbi:MAG: zinc-ribbon domain-containing protein [Casimicrobiaceae bacterium]
MNCARCGADNAANARFCTRCGTEQSRIAAPAGRGRTVLIVASCIVVALAGYGTWKLMAGSSRSGELQPPHGGIAQIPAGGAPLPTDQSAAPLPPPAALPATDGAAFGAASEAASTAGVEPATSNAGGRVAAPAASEDSVSAASAKTEAPASEAVISRSGAGVAARTGAHPRAARSHNGQSGHPSAPARTTPAPAEASVPPIAAATAPATPKASDHWTRMNDDLSRCTRKDFINRVICDQRVRFQYCDGYWGTVPQCPVSPSTESVR